MDEKIGHFTAIKLAKVLGGISGSVDFLTGSTDPDGPLEDGPGRLIVYELFEKSGFMKRLTSPPMPTKRECAKLLSQFMRRCADAIDEKAGT